MKYLKMLFIIFILLMQNNYAQEIKDNQLVVYGKVKVFAQTDRAKIVFNIKGFGSDLDKAFNNAKATMDTVTVKLANIGLDKKNISTSFFQSSENFGDKAFLSSKKDYHAIMTVTITTDSLVLLEPIVFTLNECNIERIQSISFDLKNYMDLRKKGLQNAVVKAKEKAELIAQQLGIECGKILNIEELHTPDPEIPSSHYGYGYNRSPYNSVIVAAQASYDMGSGQTSLYSQEVSFFSEVKMVFEIIDKNSDVINP